MKATRRDVLAVLAGAILWAPRASVFAQPKATEPAKRREAAPPPKTSDAGPEYVPSQRGTPGGRVSGAGRGGTGRDIFVLSVLAPDHTGLTIREQPTLYWFISKPTPLPVEITITDPSADPPMLQTRLKSTVDRGVHRLRLTDHDIRLVSGVAYQWSVAVIPDVDRRSRDILASGMIERVEPEGSLVSKLAQANAQERIFAYARAGIWYDALGAVSDLIERSPADQTPRSFRAALLKQVGLPEVDEER